MCLCKFQRKLEHSGETCKDSRRTYKFHTERPQPERSRLSPLLLVLIFKRFVQMLKLISSYAAMQTRADADCICPISMFASMQSLFAVKSCRKNCPSAAWICKSVTICHFTTIGCAAKTLLSINVLLSYLYIPMLMKLNQWHLTCLKWCKPRDNESVVANFLISRIKILADTGCVITQQSVKCWRNFVSLH